MLPAERTLLPVVECDVGVLFFRPVAAEKRPAKNCEALSRRSEGLPARAAGCISGGCGSRGRAEGCVTGGRWSRARSEGRVSGASPEWREGGLDALTLRAASREDPTRAPRDCARECLARRARRRRRAWARSERVLPATRPSARARRNGNGWGKALGSADEIQSPNTRAADSRTEQPPAPSPQPFSRSLTSVARRVAPSP